MDEQKTSDSATGRGGKPEAGFRAAAFQQVSESGGGTGDAHPSIDVILDVPVTLSLEVGRTRMPIRNLLQLNQGSGVELERGAGEPLDVLVNGALVAHGEIVVINDKFGIRLTDVVPPAKRAPAQG